MADTAFQTMYRMEAVEGFEQRQSLLRDACTTEANVNGNEAVFLVADSGGATATTRGANGLIPARADDLTQNTCTLAEWHDLVRKTNFNIFASQGDQRAIMQATSMGVINRRIDNDILTALSSATVTTGTATTASLNLVMRALTILGNSEVPFDGNIWAVISPAFYGYLMQIKEFANSEYVMNKPFDGNSAAWADKPGFYRWSNVNWIVHPKVSGVGTSSETCYMFHKSAIGHAVNIEGFVSEVGRDGEQGYSWARTSVSMGSKLLQNSGVVKMIHDGSALAA